MSTIEKIKNNIFPVEMIRADFPILQQKIHGKPLIYLDNAATTQKPKSVIDAITHYYSYDNANVHRGIHTLSEQATGLYARARETVRQFVNAASAREIIFLGGVTEAINLVAESFGSSLKKDDEIIISAMEHHSNIVPWQRLCEEKELKLRVIPIDDTGEINIEEYKKLLNEKIKLIAVTHLSNTLGIINPIKKMIMMAHEYGIPVLIDGAQAVAHMPVDVRDLDCDFYVFSGHKMYAPTGIGVLYGKNKYLEKMLPYKTGGGMIRYVTFEKTEYQEAPEKFEAGTPPIAGAIGLAAAINYLDAMGRKNIINYEAQLFNYALTALSSISKLHIIGNSVEKAAVISFVLEHIHPHDIATILDHEGIAVRAGHHCTMPLMNRLNLIGTVRASLALYNTKEEIDALVKGIDQVKRIFSSC